MFKLITLILSTLLLSSCILTKAVTVPMRVTGAVISVVPFVGESVDEAIDVAADVIDAVPI
jgi:hypothetical protein